MCSYLQEERNAGHAAGLKEGEKKGLINAIRAMLGTGKTPEEIAKFSGFDLDFILNVQAQTV